MNKIMEAYNNDCKNTIVEAKKPNISGDFGNFDWDYDPNKNEAELYLRESKGWNEFTLKSIAEGKHTDPVDQIVDHLYEEESIEVSDKYKGKFNWWGSKGEVTVKFNGKPSFLDNE